MTHKINRSAKSGQFVTKKAAKKHPNTTVTEKLKKAPRYIVNPKRFISGDQSIQVATNDEKTVFTISIIKGNLVVESSQQMLVVVHDRNTVILK